MAELILTPAEKAAETWCELPDDVVGKLTKYSIAKIAEVASERELIWTHATAMMLVDLVRRSNAETLTQTIDGYTYAGAEYGDWKITVEKIPA